MSTVQAMGNGATVVVMGMHVSGNRDLKLLIRIQQKVRQMQLPGIKLI